MKVNLLNNQKRSTIETLYVFCCTHLALQDKDGFEPKNFWHKELRLSEYAYIVTYVTPRGYMHFGSCAYFWKAEIASFSKTSNFIYFALKTKENNHFQFLYIILTNMRISRLNMRISSQIFIPKERALYVL